MSTEEAKRKFMHLQQKEYANCVKIGDNIKRIFTYDSRDRIVNILTLLRNKVNTVVSIVYNEEDIVSESITIGYDCELNGYPIYSIFRRIDPDDESCIVEKYQLLGNGNTSTAYIGYYAGSKLDENGSIVGIDTNMPKCIMNFERLDAREEA